MPRRRDDQTTPSKPPRASRQLPGSARVSPHEAGARPVDLSARLMGVVNKHFPEKGFGFIREQQTGREYFFHYEGTREGTREAFQELYVEGAVVKFDGRNGPKGWRASAVELV